MSIIKDSGSQHWKGEGASTSFNLVWRATDTGIAVDVDRHMPLCPRMAASDHQDHLLSCPQTLERGRKAQPSWVINTSFSL